MNIQMLLIVQIAVEVILCMAVVFLLVQGFGKGRSKGPTPPLPEKADLERLRALLVQSRDEFQNFQEAMDRGRETLIDLMRQIDDREKSLELLLEQARKQRGVQKTEGFSGGAEDSLRYKDAACLIRQGKPDREIARECGVTEGEVSLIKGLLSAGNETL